MPALRPDRGLTAIAGVAAAGMFAPLVWLIASRRVLTQLDLGWFNLPVRHLYREALRGGDSPWWTPALFSGYFIHGDGQGGAAHPLHLLLYRFLPLDVAFNLEITASYAFAFAGMLVLQRRLALSRPASLLGAILFAFGGFNLMHLNHMNAVAIMAHAPWMCAAVDAMVSSSGRARTRGAAALAALLGSQILLGYPQYVWLSILAAAAFGLVRASDRPRPGRSMFAGAGVFAIALIAGALAGAAQLLPNVAALAESSRGAMDATFTYSFSLHPWNLLQLWSPYAFSMRVFHDTADIQPHEVALYNGAFCTAAIGWLAMRHRSLGTRRRLVIGLGCCAGVFLLLALGKYGGAYWLVAQLPVIRVFRAPARYIAVVHLFAALLGAIAFDDLAALARAERPAGTRGLWAFAALAALSGLTIAVPFLVPQSAEVSGQFSALPRLALGFVLVAGTIAVMTSAARGAWWAPALLIPIVAGDLALWGWAYAWRPAPVPLTTFVSRIDVPAGSAPPSTLYERAGIPAADLPALRGARMFNGYVGMWPLRVLPLESTAAQRLGGVTWRHEIDAWHPVSDPMPRARLIADVRVSTDPARDVETIDIARTALVPYALGSFAAGAGDARVVADSPGRLTIDVHVTARQLLVLTERFDSGWRATADGAHAETVRAYGDQLAVVVDAGARRVECRFAPVSVRAGVALSLLGCAIIAAALLASRTTYSWGAAEG
jgi:hypothetical protein